MTRLAPWLLLALGACTAPAHTAAWWRAHPEDAKAEVARCKSQANTDTACRIAEQALADVQRAAREAEFKKAIGDGH